MGKVIKNKSNLQLVASPSLGYETNSQKFHDIINDGTLVNIILIKT